MHTLAKPLDLPAYAERVKLPRYNGPITLFQALSDRDAAAVLTRLNQNWSLQNHKMLADSHAQQAMVQQADYERLLDEAAMETFGRPFLITDYRVSAIGRSEFSEEKKDQIRFAAHASNCHKQASRAHAVVANRKGGRCLLSHHATPQEAMCAMDQSIDTDPLQVMPAEIVFAANGNVRLWTAL